MIQRMMRPFGWQLPFVLLALFVVAGCGDETTGPSDTGVTPVYSDDFEDGDYTGWRTWTYGPDGVVTGSGFTLSVEGDSSGCCGAAERKGLRLHREVNPGTDILERELRLNPNGDLYRIAVSVRPFLGRHENLCLEFSISDSAATRNPSTCIRFTSDGRVRDGIGDDLGGFTPGLWYALILYVDPVEEVFGFVLNCYGNEPTVSGGWYAHGRFGETGFFQVRCSGSGESDSAIDDISSTAEHYEAGVLRLDDFQYEQGKYFFLTDPDGAPMDEDGIGALMYGSVEVWIDDRDATSDQDASPAYVTPDGLVSTVRQDIFDGKAAIGEFNRLTAGTDYIVQEDAYPGYPILIVDDARRLDASMSKTLAVKYGTTQVEVGGNVGTEPDTLVLKMIRPAAGVGGTDPRNLASGVFAPAARLELRNIYDLGDNLEPNKLTVRIRRKATIGGVTDPDQQDGHPLLEILGLDLYTNSSTGQTAGPDGKIDWGRIHFASGFTTFRELQPFAPTDGDIANRMGAPDPPRPALIEVRSPEIYNRNLWGPYDPESYSLYYFEIYVLRYPWAQDHASDPRDSEREAM